MENPNADIRIVYPDTVDIWFIIFGFLSPNDEFAVALVCKMFYDILKTIRQSRRMKLWETSIAHPIFNDFAETYCTTPENITLYLRAEDTRVMNVIKHKVVPLTLRFGYYDSLCEILNSYDMDSNLNLCMSVFCVLMTQKQYDVVRRLIKKGLCMPWYDFFKPAVKSGQIDLVKHTYIPTYMFDGDELRLAIISGNMDVVSFVSNAYKTKGCSVRYPTTLLYPAIDSGNLDILKFVQEIGAYFSSHALEYAFNAQKLDMLEYIVENSDCLIPTCITRALDTLPTELAEIIMQKPRDQDVDYNSDW